jgi:hypothetical protein
LSTEQSRFLPFFVHNVTFSGAKREKQNQKWQKKNAAADAAVAAAEAGNQVQRHVLNGL